jgi:GT2 family glycosyltransferase
MLGFSIAEVFRTMETAQLRAEWLGWDGSRLRWRMHADADGVAGSALLLDGIDFQRYASLNAGTHEMECEFTYSPSGQVELEFKLVSAGEAAQVILASWNVRHAKAATPGTSAWTQAPRAMAPLVGAPRLPSLALADLPPVAVVVAIYNSPQCVQRCIESLLRWSTRVRIILVDDASTDLRIGEILAAVAGRANILVQRNERNRGYTHSVNVGMGLAGGADVVLLNSDTEVGPRWLVALKLAAYSGDDIGTVTAVSDNAGAFSVPELEQHCPIPSRWNLQQTQRAILQQAGLRYPQLPTGNGFCMYVKRVVLARIGPMDEAAFPQGYGEENDFCQRAERAGYRNIIAGNVLVHHERSASFGEARRATLGAQGMQVLRARYPDYERDVGETLFSFARRTLDYRVRRTYADSDGNYTTHPPQPRLLIAADADDTGAERLLATLRGRHEGFLLRREDDWVNLYRHAEPALIFERGVTIGDGAAALKQVETRLREWLIDYAIESLHLRGSAASDGWLAGLAAGLDIPTA